MIDRESQAVFVYRLSHGTRTLFSVVTKRIYQMKMKVYPLEIRFRDRGGGN